MQTNKDDKNNKISNRFIEKRRVKVSNVDVFCGSTQDVYGNTPGEVGWAAEEFLIEIISPSADRLRERQTGGDDGGE